MKTRATAPGARPTPGGITAEEFWELSKDRRSELVDGEIIEMTPTGAEHGSVVVKLVIHLGTFIQAHDLGNLSAGEVGCKIRTKPDTVRAPDIAFVTKARIPKEGVPQKFWPMAPDLAVEVVSPSDTYEQVELKVRDWLEAGTREVWVVNPRLRQIKVHRKGRPPEVYDPPANLRSEDLFPGLALPVAEVFGS